MAVVEFARLAAADGSYIQLIRDTAADANKFALKIVQADTTEATFTPDTPLDLVMALRETEKLVNQRVRDHQP